MSHEQPIPSTGGFLVLVLREFLGVEEGDIAWSLAREVPFQEHPWSCSQGEDGGSSIPWAQGKVTHLPPGQVTQVGHYLPAARHQVPFACLLCPFSFPFRDLGDSRDFVGASLGTERGPGVPHHQNHWLSTAALGKAFSSLFPAFLHPHQSLSLSFLIEFRSIKENNRAEVKEGCSSPGEQEAAFIRSTREPV